MGQHEITSKLYYATKWETYQKPFSLVETLHVRLICLKNIQKSLALSRGQAYKFRTFLRHPVLFFDKPERVQVRIHYHDRVIALFLSSIPRLACLENLNYQKTSPSSYGVKAFTLELVSKVLPFMPLVVNHKSRTLVQDDETSCKKAVITHAPPDHELSTELIVTMIG